MYTVLMELEEFEDLVRQAITSVPERFRQRLENVAFVVEHYARRPDRREQPILERGVLLGLYQGVPYGQRGPWYSGVLPDKITIFQDTIEAVAGGDPTRIAKVVTNTVHHEIGHYFGMNESEVRSWERQRRARKPAT